MTASEKAKIFIADLESRSQTNDPTYKINEAEGDQLLEIIESFGVMITKTAQQNNPTDHHVAVRACWILTNVVDRKIAKKVKNFLDRKPKLDWHIESSLRAGLMRMAGY